MLFRSPTYRQCPSANWTNGLLAPSLATKTHMTVTAETEYLYLRAASYVCKRPTWPPLKRQAEEQPGSVSNACGVPPEVPELIHLLPRADISPG